MIIFKDEATAIEYTQPSEYGLDPVDKDQWYISVPEEYRYQSQIADQSEIEYYPWAGNNGIVLAYRYRFSARRGHIVYELIAPVNDFTGLGIAHKELDFALTWLELNRFLVLAEQQLLEAEKVRSPR